MCRYIYHLGNFVFATLTIVGIVGVVDVEAITPYAIVAFLFGGGGVFIFLATYVYVLFVWTFTDYKSEKYIDSNSIRFLSLNIIAVLFLSMVNVRAESWLLYLMIVNLAFMCHLQMAEVQ